MNLLPPRIKGPISECNPRIRVQGQFPGSDVDIMDIDASTIVASGAATSSDGSIPTSAALVPGHQLAGQQKLGSDISEFGVETVQVQAVPSPVGPVAFGTPLFVCGECVWLEGLVPGADVVVRDAGTDIGTGSTLDGVARVHLSQPFTPSSAITAQQDACGSPGMNTSGPTPEPAVGKEGERLPPPVIESPLVACESRVTVSEVFPGATVRLSRSAGPDPEACFDLPALYFGVNPPLAEGETLVARQAFPKCDLEGPWSEPVVVDPLEPVPVPGVNVPLCVGGTNITVTGLKFGARVRITVAPKDPHGGFPVGGDVYEAVAPEDGGFDFPFPAGLPADHVVYATQELCGKQSDPSNLVEIDPAPGLLPKPRIPRPIFECATVVHVENLAPGTRVYVFSKMVGGVIGEQQVFDDEADVPVAPLLQAGDELHAFAVGCSLRSAGSDSVQVKDLDDLPAPKVVEPLYSCQGTVHVTNVVPGAFVDVYVNGVWRGRKKSGGDEVNVPIAIRQLDVDDQVTARQWLCGCVSRDSKVVTVEAFRGRWFQVGGDKKAEILAIHAALLSTGHILYFGGDQHDAAAANDPDASPPKAGDVDHTRLFNCATHDVRKVTGLPPSADLFCAGHAFLEDGRLITGGGTYRWAYGGGHWHESHFPGNRESWRFLPTPVGGESWDPVNKLSKSRPEDVISGGDPEMTGGRWYPTLCTLPDGRVLAIGGHPLPDDERHTNTSLELYNPATKTWSLVGSTDYDNIPGAAQFISRGRHSEYPRMHVLPEGTVFVVSTMEDEDIWKWTPYSDPLAWTRVAGPPPDGPGEDPQHNYRGNPQPTTSVLLPLHHDRGFSAKVLLCGAPTAFTIEPESSSPSWTATGGRSLVDYPVADVTNPYRIYLNATLLPSGEVFVSGGTHNKRDAQGVKTGEMYDPDSNSWSNLPEAKEVRNYHSTALLMPNGAVWHAGSNIDCQAGGERVRNLTIEIFEPWYFCYDRPIIEDVQQKVCHGGRLRIRTPHAHAIDKVVLIRCGSVTHAFNPDQRWVSIPFQRDKEKWNELVASVPDNPNVLVPGCYLLHLVTADRVPSEGQFVYICRERFSGPIVMPEWWKWLAEGLRLLPIDRRIIDELLPPPHAPDKEDDDVVTFRTRIAEIEEVVRGLGARLDRLEQKAPPPKRGKRHGHGRD